jgi:hypothetical protein
MGRIGYKKSRNGCCLCKQRRVKVCYGCLDFFPSCTCSTDTSQCDEKRPCSGCNRNGVQCSLIMSSYPSNTYAGVSRTPTYSMYATHLTSTQKKPILAVPSSLYVNPDVSKSGMIDLKLMHHWTTNASLKTPVSSIAHQIYFQDDLPRMAPRFPCLLHQILALSALHFAYLHPGVSSEYSVRAFQHQNMAIGSMRDALSSGVTRANSTAIYMTSALLVASQFTSRLNNDMRSSCPLAALL